MVSQRLGFGVASKFCGDREQSIPGGLWKMGGKARPLASSTWTTWLARDAIQTPGLRRGQAQWRSLRCRLGTSPS